jgi:aminoglycoside phosphotransferase (APT) family kinase protein
VPADDTLLLRRLGERVEALCPGSRVVSIDPLAPDTGARSSSTKKAAGYGLPVRVVLVDAQGQQRELVWRTASANEFGHDRRADRAASMIQAFDDFGRIPAHVEAIDLGVIRRDGSLLSVRDADEHYLITSFAPGTIYADDLRRIVTTGVAEATDLARLDAMVEYLAALHTPIAEPGVRYRRAIRDLIGSGEGILGIIDGYPPDVPSASTGRLRAIEEQCATWRWRLREHDARLTRTHGDFHPFNLVFGEATQLTLLDASRGGCGDPADDLTAMAVNFMLFALDAPAAWPHGLGVLWHRWWSRYLALRSDPQLLDVAPVFFAWRALVVANPRFYPSLTAPARDRLLGFAEDVLEVHRLDPAFAEELFP